MKFECRTCGPQELMLFDASLVEERAFEGVWFTIAPADDSDGYDICYSDDEYFRIFNMDYMLSQAREFIEEGSGIVCPVCKEEVEND